MIDGILLINKPQDFTSFDVIAKLRGILKERKIGHGGTLDPNVTGVLPVFIGKATKAIDLAPVTDKKYTATFKLGIETDTQDIWGEIVNRYAPEKDIEKIEKTVLSFKGKQKQLPPMYSAIRVNGKRLYDLAREGVEIERQLRDITVYDISFEGKISEDEYKFSVFCSKGSYVRTICADIGSKLNCGATMTSLVRTEALGFDIKNCYTLNEVQSAADEGRVDRLIIPVDMLFEKYPPITLSEKQSRLYKNGVGLEPSRVSGVIYDTAYTILDEQIYRVYDFEEKFIGIGKVDYQKREFRSVKMFLSE